MIAHVGLLITAAEPWLTATGDSDYPPIVTTGWQLSTYGDAVHAHPIAYRVCGLVVLCVFLATSALALFNLGITRTWQVVVACVGLAVALIAELGALFEAINAAAGGLRSGSADVNNGAVVALLLIVLAIGAWIRVGEAHGR